MFRRKKEKKKLSTVTPLSGGIIFKTTRRPGAVIYTYILLYVAFTIN